MFPAQIPTRARAWTRAWAPGRARELPECVKRDTKRTVVHMRARFLFRPIRLGDHSG